MKAAITTILLALLVLGGCSTEEGAKRIYPDGGLFQERWSRTEVTDIEFYSDEVEFRTSYKLFFLNRSKGSIHAGDGYPEESGWCIEEGWRWYWNEETNTGTYEIDRG